MIEKTPAWKTSDGQTFENIADAQKHELEQIFKTSQLAFDTSEAAARIILQHAPAIIDILTTTAKSKPRARKIHGGTKMRKNKPTEQTA